MQDYLLKMKQKPQHVRQRIAVGASVGITAFVGLIWVATMTTSGAFALNNGAPAATNTSNAAPSSNAFALDGTNVKSNFSQLVGAVGAATGATSSQPSLTIIDGKTTSSFSQPSGNANPSATVIPF